MLGIRICGELLGIGIGSWGRGRKWDGYCSSIKLAESFAIGNCVCGGMCGEKSYCIRR